MQYFAKDNIFEKWRTINEISHTTKIEDYEKKEQFILNLRTNIARITNKERKLVNMFR